eukprot:NODE_45_length_3118_cov_45.737374_g30_i0.p1 GENE.NODE_45_length_3118_cov_45.737374_g30_i0~~NODE_45_length_3118_cov_45.737374_g30_i0.p1  ORF type:complete len:922 (-),score=217.46 NODE_45_length_3118_cov_45.737374_g30_i0:353-3064(-)
MELKPLILEAVAVTCLLGFIFYITTEEHLPTMHVKWRGPRVAVVQALKGPTPMCTASSTAATMSGLKSTCSYLNTKSGCCTADPSVEAATTQFQSLCTSSETSCYNYLVGYWCSASCLKTQLTLCDSENNAFASACANCPKLIAAGYAPSTRNSSSNITSNCTSSITQPPAASAAPSFTSFNMTPATTNITLDYSDATGQTWTFVGVIASKTSVTMLVQFLVKDATTTSGWRAYINQSATGVLSGTDIWTAKTTICMEALNAQNGTTKIQALADNGWAQQAGPQSPTGVDTMEVTVTGTASLTAADTVSSCSSQKCPKVAGSSKTTSLPASIAAAGTMTCDCPASCLFSGAGQALTVQTFNLQSSSSALSGFVATIVNLVISPGATNLELSKSVLKITGPFTLNVDFFQFIGDAASSMSFAAGSSFTIPSGKKLVSKVRLVFEVVASIAGNLVADGSPLQAGSGGGFDIAGAVTAQSTTLAEAIPAILLGAGSTATGAGALNLAGGFASFVGTVIDVTYSAKDFATGALSSTSSNKFMSLRYVPASGKSTTEFCQVLVSKTSTITAGNQLLIPTTCAYQPQLSINGVFTTVQSYITAQVSIADQAYLTFDQVSTATNMVSITSLLTMGTNAFTEVIIKGSSSFADAGQKIYLARFQKSGWNSGTTDCARLPPNILSPVPGCPVGRTCSVLIESETAAATNNFCRFYLNVSASTIASANRAQHKSNTYSLMLNRDCATFTAVHFIDIITRLASPSVPTWVVTVNSIVCGSMTVTYHCNSFTSVAAATSTCSAIQAQAQNKHTDLSKELGTLTTAVASDDSSNGSLFALFVLILVPIFCVIGAVVWYKTKRKEADKQYLHETSVFNSKGYNQQPGAPAQQPPQMAAQPMLPPPGYAPLQMQHVAQ